MKTKLGYESMNKQSQLINWYPALKRYCRSITRNDWDGDDLAQETMIKMYRSYVGKDCNRNKISLALLYKIAHNQWIDQLRKTKETTITHKELSYEPMKGLPDLYSNIEKLVNHLTPKQTIIFLLKDVFEYSLADISAQLAMSEGSIKASLFRSRNRLKSIEIKEESENPSIISDVNDQMFHQTILEAIRQENPSELIKQFYEIRMKEIGSVSSQSSHFTPQCLHLQAA
ncbi:sigma-70 family RNA polymerase sigma factor [Heyndrickxia sporothermodurans]|uniref:sigma-70 family RNA polymerase sigma factor n=1 Tax=Heyndrickxia sporothermodurans TaxID=46224 RepID=UPI002DB72082|nr:sigma-70 family RNA polymerase sigma factor [Heyndrickxia sporothermodurans]MEB6550307.1 sigma-70 family RNA polymerase sigma factor [Heyndrickxia sporothermodurans]